MEKVEEHVNSGTPPDGGNNVGGERLTNRNLFGFSLGGIGRDMAYGLFNTYLLTYILFTKSLSDAQFATVSMIIVFCRIFDALNDPIMGGIVEITRTKWGKFKPWIFIGAITCSAVIITAFSTKLQGWAFIGLLGAIYFLFSITFTMNDISYWGMLPSLSPHPEDRNKLTSVATLCASAGGAAIGFLVPTFTAGNMTIGGSAVTAYSVMAIVTAVMFIGCQVFTCFAVKEKPLPPLDPNRERGGLKKMFKVILKNDQLLWVSIAFLAYNVGNNVVGALNMTYIYFEFGYNGFLLTVFGVLFGVAAVFVNLSYPFLAKKFNRKKLVTIAIIMIILGYSMMLLFGSVLPSEPWMLKFALLMLGFFFVGFGQTVFYTILFISVANTVEYNEWKTGEREEGLIFSMRPFMAKMGSALSQLVVMLVYLIIGVTVFTNQISDLENTVGMDGGEKASKIESIIASVPQAKKIALLASLTLIPIVLIGVAYIIYRSKFKIDEKMFNDMAAEISQRKAAENADAE